MLSRNNSVRAAALQRSRLGPTNSCWRRLEHLLQHCKLQRRHLLAACLHERRVRYRHLLKDVTHCKATVQQKL